MIKKLLIGVMVLAVLAPATQAFAYDKDYVGEMEVYRAKYEDTLVHLARKHGLGFVEMRAANPKLDPWIPGEGARVILPMQHILPDAPEKGIVINLAEMRLYYYGDGKSAPISYSIGIGREGLRTPIGETTIQAKKVGPTWTPTDRMRREDPKLPAFVPPGPANPLGTHAMYLGFPQIRIHGTDKPYGIGRRLSSGCIRMYPEGIVDLFPRVPVGTKVTVVDQPVKVGWIDDKMFIEVSPTQDQSLAIEEDGLLKSYEITKQDMKRITAKAGPYAPQIDWQSVREAVRDHAGYPVAVLDIKRKPGERVKDDLHALLNEAGTNVADIKLDAADVGAPAKTDKQQPVKEEPRKKADKQEAVKLKETGSKPSYISDTPKFND
jgi:L,D-transpeptidase ErfK/SrfK